jgi:hypothetical protein
MTDSTKMSRFCYDEISGETGSGCTTGARRSKLRKSASCEWRIIAKVGAVSLPYCIA